jgi:hypothetical protein
MSEKNIFLQIISRRKKFGDKIEEIIFENIKNNDNLISKSFLLEIVEVMKIELGIFSNIYNI